MSIDRDLNAAINIRNIGLIKVGKGIPEFTPVESATGAELLKGGSTSCHSMNQEPPLACDGEDVSNRQQNKVLSIHVKHFNKNREIFW